MFLRLSYRPVCGLKEKRSFIRAFVKNDLMAMQTLLEMFHGFCDYSCTGRNCLVSSELRRCSCNSHGESQARISIGGTCDEAPVAGRGRDARPLPRQTRLRTHPELGRGGSTLEGTAARRLNNVSFHPVIDFSNLGCRTSISRFPLLLDCRSGSLIKHTRALHTETKVEGGMS